VFVSWNELCHAASPRTEASSLLTHVGACATNPGERTSRVRSPQRMDNNSLLKCLTSSPSLRSALIKRRSVALKFKRCRIAYLHQRLGLWAPHLSGVYVE
jgi:hypothetical protein